MERLLIILLLIILQFKNNSTKYIEGRIKTSDNWAFLTRFCFLSEEGQFEYFLEFTEDQGVPNLLFYYDTDDQWPAIYKTNKNCYEKESVLHTEQKQIINLTVSHPYFKELSRCTYYTARSGTVKPTTTTQKPKIITQKIEHKNIPVSPTTPIYEDFTTKMTDESSITDFSEDFGFYSSGSTTISSLLNSASTETIEEFLGDDIEVNKAPIKKRSLQRDRNEKNSKNRTILCHNVMKFRSARERWWFIALSNCQGTKGINVKYNILMTNGPPGDYWHEHFSADEFYILPILLAFSIAYSLLVLGIIICTIELKSRQLLHSTYKIFVFSALCQLFGIIITSAAYLKYAVNGIGPSRVRRFGSILMGASETLYLLLLLLLAKGYTITRGRLRLGSSVKLTIFMCLYVVTYISIFIYEAIVFDPGEVLYLYESPAGYGLITLRMIAWFMFIYGTLFTLKHYPEKGNFYYPFCICGTLWFIAGPAFILSANTYIDKWVRESVVCAVLQFITFGGHLTFLVLTMPSVANKNFPYHVRTSQIGIMELTGSNGVSTIEQFGHHVYQPTNNITTQSIVVPLTRRTEEIYEGMYAHDMQTTIRQQQQQQNELQPIQQPNENLANVLNWSLAKNITALEIPNFNRHKRQDSLASSISESQSEICVSRRPSNLHEENRQIDEYIRDVPIELFTVSRMTTVPKSEQQQQNKND